ncbi:DUF4328 domain-containing protein [Embleya scabrispora]|uniref:DUF4328 domain-containing protein n=1 Tax=Embleya scabrispora TaxID=159449 RepID=UPI000365826E|nr:DUF4328 domain-containing protein [Embleya scabrispora]MYS78962.1 DUF4328 domain-containing protein [Streptomyces sp. SID5474]
MHCSACDTWSTRADRCSYCGAVPAAAAPQQPGTETPVVAGPAAAPATPAAPTPPDPYAAPAPAPAGAYAGAYPHAPGQFAPQTPYGMPGAYPASPYPGWLPQPFRALRGLAVSLYILLPLSAVFAGLCAAAFFHRADVLRRISDAGELGMTDALRTKAEDSDSLVAAATTFLVLSMIATAVLFIIWMYRARANVDLFGPSKQHLSTGWAIGGWLVPVVSLWFPKLILHDVWRASDPRTAERGGRTPGRLPLLWAWWVLLVASGVLFFASRLSYPLDEDVELSDADRLRTIDFLSGVADVVLILAAVAAILVVRKITTFQHEREALAFASGLVTGGVPGTMPGMPAAFAGGAPTPWAAYPAQAPTARYFAPPVPQAPGTPGAPPVPQAPTVVASAVGPDGAAASDGAAAPVDSAAVAGAAAVAPAEAAVANGAATGAASAPAAHEAAAAADATTVLPVDGAPAVRPKQVPPPRPTAAPTAGVVEPVSTPAVAESQEPVSLSKPTEAVEPAVEPGPEPAAETVVEPAPEPVAGPAAESAVDDVTEDEGEHAPSGEDEVENEVRTPAEPEAEPTPAPDSTPVPVPAAAVGTETAAEAEVAAETAPADSAEPIDAGESVPAAPPVELPQVPAQAPALADRVQDVQPASPAAPVEDAGNTDNARDTVDAPVAPVAEPTASGERRS